MDKVAYGGEGRLKRSCKERTCENISKSNIKFEVIENTANDNTKGQTTVNTVFDPIFREMEGVSVMNNSVIDSILTNADIKDEFVDSYLGTLPSERVFPSDETLDSILADAVMALAGEKIEKNGDLTEPSNINDVTELSNINDGPDGVILNDNVETEDNTTEILNNSVLDIKQEIPVSDSLATDSKLKIRKALSRTFQCNDCSYTTKNKHFLDKHKRSVHNKEFRFQCSGCAFKSFFKFEVANHQTEVHSQTEDLNITGIGCELCEMQAVHVQCDFVKKSTIGDQKPSLLEKKNKCEECEYTSRQSGNLDFHIRSHHKNEVRYRCEACNFENFFKLGVFNHRKSAHTESTPRVIGIGCNSCHQGMVHSECDFVKNGLAKNQTQKGVLCLEEGVKGNDYVYKRQYLCEECKFVSSRKKYLSIHIALNHGTHPIPKEEILKCDQCELETNKAQTLLIHKRALHDGEVRFSCQECIYKTYFTQSIKLHIKKCHSDSKLGWLLVGCTHCELGINHKLCEILPRKTLHDSKNIIKTKKEYLCQECKFKSPKVMYFRYHKVLNHGSEAIPIENILRCDQCEYETNKNKSLDIHKRSIHNKEVRFACPECPFMTFFIIGIREHIKRQHKGLEHNFLRVGCSLCDSGSDHQKCEIQKGETRRRRKRTSQWGITDFKYACVECKYSSPAANKVTKHKKLRHGNAGLAERSKLMCSRCQYVCDQLKHMNDHTKTVHNNIIYKCKDCDYTTSKERFFTRHQNFRHSKDALPEKIITRCDQCGYECDNPTNMYVHKKAIHDKSKRFTCSNCEYKSFFSQNVEDHLKAAHKGSGARPLTFGCAQCEAKENHSRCDSRRTIKSNQRYAASLEKKFQIGDYVDMKCELCSYTGSSEQTIRRHIESVHGDVKRFACSGCNLKTYDRTPLKKHIGRFHRDSDATIISLDCSNCVAGLKHDVCLAKNGRPWNENSKKRPPVEIRTCKFCGFVANKWALLIKHIAKDHPALKLHNCDKCSYGSNYLPNLNTHKAAKHSGTMFECDICGWKTAWKPPFFEHRREKHGIFLRNSKYKEDLELSESLCDLCGFAGTSKRAMRLHKKSFCRLTSNVTVNGYPTSSKDVSTSDCEKCAKFASNPKALAQHMSIFHERKYRNCTLCGFHATSFYQLNTHKYEKHRQGQSNCTVCGIKCRNRFRLLIHINGKHPESVSENAKGKKNYDGLGVKFSCDLCKYEGQTTLNLSLHEKRVHAERFLENRERISANSIDTLPALSQDTSTNPKAIQTNPHIQLVSPISSRAKKTNPRNNTRVQENYPQLTFIKV